MIVYERLAEAILKESGEGNYDLIIIGSRGRGNVKPLIMGSLSREVLCKSIIPVLIVHHNRDKGQNNNKGQPARVEKVKARAAERLPKEMVFNIGQFDCQSFNRFYRKRRALV